MHHLRSSAIARIIRRHSTALTGICLAAMMGQARAAGPIRAVGIENEYANVIQQIGGRYVTAGAIESNPNTDPHTFEASPEVARQIATAALIVENGVGYDGWADKIIAASPNPHRVVINVQRLLGLPNATPNPHLWYDPTTMPRVAQAVAAALGRMAPGHAAYFKANVAQFDRSLQPWYAAIAAFKAKHDGTPVAVTEPVGDYMLQAVGADIKTPFSLQAAIMNGTDPSPQDVATQNALFNRHAVKVFVYNQQVTDPLTASFLDLARKNHIPVVGVYETMPTPGYTYQSWMLAEVQALQRAVTAGVSTRSLLGAAGQRP
ncbi:metal ABC transporter solute-binding protein, Zn/Mn family [Acidiphilium sp.]|uniref:metal ABC transporter solute-binding protein, Zn/Mn family n=1 Tax=Acidiphilium sp. TaxID=527 RepID=UPI003D0373CB